MIFLINQRLIVFISITRIFVIIAADDKINRVNFEWRLYPINHFADSKGSLIQDIDFTRAVQ
ncbi:hypothetical protein CS542_03805 [Pedobacter sp. IW39]|nr:hypothetical protein CS542_03805 [Pedobacter sp. IW39]